MAGACIVAAIWNFTKGGPSVELKVVGMEVKQWPTNTPFAPWLPFFVVAHMELVNKDDKVIEYDGFGMSDSAQPVHRLLYPSPTGWAPISSGFMCRTGIQRCVISPGGSVRFDAVVDADKPCKVALDYSDGRPQSFANKIGSHLASSWFGFPVELGNGQRTAESPVIDAGQALKEQIQDETSRAAKEARLAEINGGTEFRLAGKYWVGDGVELDRAKAVGLYQISAGKGNAEAAYNLANIYEYGLGVALDTEAAAKLYQQAIENGHPLARARLDRLVANGLPHSDQGTWR